MIDLVAVHRKISCAFLNYYNEYWLFDADVPQGELKADTRSWLARWRQQRIWPRLILVVMVLVNLKVLITSIFHFKYDIEYIKLIRMANTTDATLDLKPAQKYYALNSSQYLQQEARVNASFEALKYVGNIAPNVHWAGSVMGLQTVCGSFLTLITYQLLVCFRLILPHDWYFLRVMLNEGRELEDCRRAVAAIVEQFKETSKNFHLNWADRVERVLESIESERAIRGSGNSKAGRIRLGRLPRKSPLIQQAKLHAHLSKRVDQLARQGQLLPLNRLPEMVDRMSLKFALVITYLYVTVGGFFFAILLILPLYERCFKINYLADFIEFVEIMIKMNTDLAMTLFLIAIYGTIWPNQICYMNTVRVRLRNCRAANMKLFIGYRKSGGSFGNFEQLSFALNENLMRALLEYQVFAKQFAPTKRSFALIVTSVPLLLLIDYSIMRLTMPYAGGFLLKFGIAGRSVIIAAMLDTILVPICRMNQLGEKLYEEMASLLAHAIDLNLETGELTGDQIYSAHLVWLQRQLVDGPEKMMEQFSAQAHDDNFIMSWPNLVEIHYFISMLLISFVLKLKSWENIFGGRIDDPLRLFAD